MKNKPVDTIEVKIPIGEFLVTEKVILFGALLILPIIPKCVMTIIEKIIRR